MVGNLHLVLEILNIMNNTISRFIFRNVNCGFVIIEKLEVTKQGVENECYTMQYFASLSKNIKKIYLIIPILKGVR